MKNQHFNQTQVSESGKRFIDKSLLIGDEIVRLLEKHNMTQRQLAEALGKKESQVSKWLTGFHNFTLKTLTEIEAVFGEELMLTKSYAKQRYSKAPIVLHNTVVDQEVFRQLRETEHATLSLEHLATTKQTLTPQLQPEEFCFHTLHYS